MLWLLKLNIFYFFTLFIFSYITPPSAFELERAIHRSTYHPSILHPSWYFLLNPIWLFVQKVSTELALHCRNNISIYRKIYLNEMLSMVPLSVERYRCWEIMWRLKKIMCRRCDYQRILLCTVFTIEPALWGCPWDVHFFNLHIFVFK